MKKYRYLPGIYACIVVAFILILGVSLIPRTATEDHGSESGAKQNGAERLTFLVGGTDRASGLTDVLMLVTLRTDTGSACVLQIPRDTYAAYTEKSYKKLNGAYGALGGEGLSAFLSGSLGVKIDGYMILSPNALRAAVDAMGGVEVELSKNMYYNDPAQGLYIDLKAGRQTLDGEKAEQFIRYRSGYVNGDLGRIDTQKIFLAAVAKKLKEQTSRAEMLGIAASLTSGTDTNITVDQAAVMVDALKGAELRDVALITAPGECATAKSGASYYSLSAPAMTEVLDRYFGKTESFDPKKLFLNKNNSTFGSIYEEYAEYTVVQAHEID